MGPPKSLRLFPTRVPVLILLTTFLSTGQAQQAAAQMTMSGVKMGTQDQVPSDRLPAPEAV
jgi:hypothetical protein